MVLCITVIPLLCPPQLVFLVAVTGVGSAPATVFALGWFGECLEVGEIFGSFFQADGVVKVRIFCGVVKYGVLDISNFLEDLVEDGFRVGVMDFPIIDEDISHALGDELEALHVILVLVQFLHIVFDVDFILASLLLHLVEQERDVGIGTLSDLWRDADVGDGRP